MVALNKEVVWGICSNKGVEEFDEDSCGMFSFVYQKMRAWPKFMTEFCGRYRVLH